MWRRRDVVNKRGLERELADVLIEDGLADLVNADGSAVLFLLNPDLADDGDLEPRCP